MTTFHFSKETPPESMFSDIQTLNKFSDQPFAELVGIVIAFIVEPNKSSRMLSQLEEFAQENGVSGSALKNVVKSLLVIPNSALKMNLGPEQLKEDLVSLGLSGEKADLFAEQENKERRWQLLSPGPGLETQQQQANLEKKLVPFLDFTPPAVLAVHLEAQTKFLPPEWKTNLVALSKSALGQTLSINQLVDMEWKFGVTASSSDVNKVGNTFIQLKLVINKGSKMENVFMELSLPQFYSFLHEMEKAKASLEYFS